MTGALTVVWRVKIWNKELRSKSWKENEYRLKKSDNKWYGKQFYFKTLIIILESFFDNHKKANDSWRQSDI